MKKIRLKIYRLHEMETGDRFYFLTDKKKTIYELDIEKPFEKVKQKEFWKRYGNCRNTASPGEIEHHLDDRQVIFLRNNNSPKI